MYGAPQIQGSFNITCNESKCFRSIQLIHLTSISQAFRSVILVKVDKTAHFDQIGSIRQCMEPLRYREISKRDERSRNMSSSLALSSLTSIQQVSKSVIIMIKVGKIQQFLPPFLPIFALKMSIFNHFRLLEMGIKSIFWTLL